MKASSLLIIADDLSGAADCAIAFAAAGRKTVVALDGDAPAPAATVVAADTDTRRLAPAAAAERSARAWQTLGAPGRRLYKKIDSTLRGNWSAEVAALVPLVGPAIVTPAFPATGRTVLDGQVIVRGVPLEHTETWQLEHAGREAGLRAILEAEGLRVAHFALADLRDTPQRVAAKIGALVGASAASPATTSATTPTTTPAPHERIDAIIVDAETSDDLATLARATAALDAPFFWVGSGGLSRELAALPELFDDDGAAAAPAAVADAAAGDTAATGPVLALVGSLSAISDRQCTLLRGEARVAEMTVPPAVLRDGERHPDWHAWHERIGACLLRDEDVIVRIGRDAAFDPAEGAHLSGSLAALVAPHFGRLGGLIATGGETARAMLAAVGIGSLRLECEIEAGVALGRPAHVGGPAIVTKAGAFGTEHALLGAYRHIRDTIGAQTSGSASKPASEASKPASGPARATTPAAH